MGSRKPACLQAQRPACMHLCACVWQRVRMLSSLRSLSFSLSLLERITWCG